MKKTKKVKKKINIFPLLFWGGIGLKVYSYWVENGTPYNKTGNVIIFFVILSATLNTIKERYEN